MKNKSEICIRALCVAALSLSLGSTAARAESTALREQLEKRMQRAIEAAERAETRSVSPGVRIDNLPVPQVSDVDIGALAERYSEVGQQTMVETPTLLAMVSLSMPRASLERMVADAERTGATLVMRGLKNGSIRETMEIASELIGSRKVAWAIDPESFTRFEISIVPTYVLLPAGVSPRECGSGQCFGEDSYARLAGDISIDFALERIEQNAPEFADAARQIRLGARQ